MGWRGYIDDSRKVVFFWSQKAACTTLFRVLRDNVPDCPPEKKYFHLNSKGVGTCLRHIRHEDYRSVILVRHPVLRAISAYLNKFCVYNGNPLTERSDLEPFSRELHDLFCRRLLLRNKALRAASRASNLVLPYRGSPISQLDLQKGRRADFRTQLRRLRGAPLAENVMSFEQFLDTVAYMHARRAKPRRPINGHWDTQIPAFLKKRGFQYDHVLHVENFDQEMAQIAPALDLKFTPRQLNRTPMAESDDMPMYLGNLPAWQVSNMKFGYRNFISPHTLKRISRIYTPDFKAFNYQLHPYAVDAPQLRLIA